MDGIDLVVITLADSDPQSDSQGIIEFGGLFVFPWHSGVAINVAITTT